MDTILSPHRVQPATIEVTGDGQFRTMPRPDALLERFPLRQPYRFYRFLSDLDELVEAVPDDLQRIRIGAVLLRRFLAQADWIKDMLPIPEEGEFVAGKVLYDEPGYPFNIQVMAWLPQGSPAHCHANWSLVGFLGGETAGWEENTFWSRQDDGSNPDYAYIEPISQKILKPGDVVGFTSDAIHSIRSMSNTEQRTTTPTYTFNIFGETDLSRRVEFDLIENRAIQF